MAMASKPSWVAARAALTTLRLITASYDRYSAFLNRPSASGKDAICTVVSCSLCRRAGSTNASCSRLVFCVTLRYRIFSFGLDMVDSSGGKDAPKAGHARGTLQRSENAPQRQLVARQHRFPDLTLQLVDHLERAQVGAANEDRLRPRHIDLADEGHDLLGGRRAYLRPRTP